MAQFLLIIQIINQLLPLLIQTVRTIEDGFPQRGAGQVKLDMVRSVLETGFSVLQTGQTTFDAVWPALDAVITGIVKLQKSA